MADEVKRTILEWFGCEEGMSVEEIKARLKEIFDNGLEEDREFEE